VEWRFWIPPSRQARLKASTKAKAKAQSFLNTLRTSVLSITKCSRFLVSRSKNSTSALDLIYM
jgi:hypothetical protein